MTVSAVPAFSLRASRRLFAARAVGHGADGRGDTPLGHTYNSPDFTDPEWWRKHSNITNPDSLAVIVGKGKDGMPAFGKKTPSRSKP